MKPLRIGVAARTLASHGSGPSEYLAGLASELVQQTAGRHQLFFYYNTARLLGSFPSAAERVLPGTSALIWDHLQLPLALRRDRIDLTIHPKGTIPLWAPGRQAAIMLDLGYFYPALSAYKYGNTLYMKQAMKYAARKSWLLFAISEYTRQDIIRLMKVSPERIYNIYGSASVDYSRVSDAVFLDTVRKKYGLSEPFIFYPTSLSPRKNFPRILKAFESIQDQIPHHLYFTGHAAWNNAELTLPLERLSKRVHRLGLLDGKEMAALYTLAEFAIYPSLFEGLGLPILEAFQCGTPLLVSDQSSVPEIAGNAALIVDGYSVPALAQGFLKMAKDEDLRRRLTAAGYDRAGEFTWKKTVHTLLAAIENNWSE